MGDEAEVLEVEEAPESQEAEAEATGEAEGEASETEHREESEAGPVPLERFNKVYGAKKELERKFELFRTDPEAYYEQYPDERPAPKDPEPEPAPIPQSIRDVAEMVVSGGPYDGMTFAEVYREDPFEAQALYEGYRNDLMQEQQAKQQEEQAFQDEADRFKNSLAKQMFGEAELKPEQAKEVESVQQATAKWMLDNDRLFLSMDEAYFLMNREAILRGEQVKGINALAAALGDDVLSVAGGKGDGGEVQGFGGLAGMNRSQIAAKVADMDASEYRRFLKEAPQAVRRKCPDLPWD